MFDGNLEVDGVVQEHLVVTMGYAMPAQRIELSAHDPNLKRLPKPPVLFPLGTIFEKSMFGYNENWHFSIGGSDSL